MIVRDRGRILACAVACVSILVRLFISPTVEAFVLHAIILGLPLSVIFWPEYCDQMFRLSSEGRAHSTAEPTPAFMLQLVAWILLIAVSSIPLLGPMPFAK